MTLYAIRNEQTKKHISIKSSGSTFYIQKRAAFDGFRNWKYKNPSQAPNLSLVEYSLEEVPNDSEKKDTNYIYTIQDENNKALNKRHNKEKYYSLKHFAKRKVGENERLVTYELIEKNVYKD